MEDQAGRTRANRIGIRCDCDGFNAEALDTYIL